MTGLKEYKPYEHYEDAYAVWYKKKPAHWKCEKFKYYFSEKAKKNAAHLKAGAISFGEVTYKDENNLSIDTKNSYQEVLAGEFVINPLNLNFDLKSLRTALSKINVVVSTGYIILRIHGLLNPHYSRWLLHQFDVSHMKTLGSGVRQTINYNDIGNSFFCRPPLEEQIKIAMFLDHKTVKIDSLIQKQQNLIELLKEKRQAVISHAVTKGLNPDVPMKDSGVEWLGEIPSHWRGIFGKRIFSNVRKTAQKNDKQLAVSQKYGVIPQVLMMQLNDSKVVLALKGTESFRHVEKDNFVISLRSFEGGIEHSSFDGCVSPAYTVLKNIAPLHHYYYRFLFKCQPFIAALKSSSDSLRDGKSISFEQFGNIKFPLNTIPEQIFIASFLDYETTKIDTLIQKQLKQIELLKERRTALISAAVTGKIDLRDWTPPANSTEGSLTAEEATA